MTEKLYEGKVKLVYETDKGDEIIIRHKDDTATGNGERKATIQGKGALNLAITIHIFEMLEENGAHAHYIETPSDTDIRAKRVTILPLRIIIRNISAGSFAKRYGVEEGIEFKKPTFEPSYRNDDLEDPLMNEDHTVALGLVTGNQYDEIKKTALEINDLLKDFFHGIGVILVDFETELGTDKDGNILLADEIDPDTCRLWDEKTKEKLDKDIFRRGLGNLTKDYQEVLDRIRE